MNTQIAVCFQQPEISELFAELLRMRGADVLVTEHLSDLEPSAKVVTEPHFFPTLASTLHSKCLLVTNRSSDAPTGIATLVRPLTLEKIEQALSRLVA